MSDNGMTSDTAPPPGSFDVETPAPVNEPAPADDLLAEPSPEQAVFDRGYVESLRREGAKYRTEAQRYNDVFSPYEQADQEVWLNLVRGWAVDPVQTARYMQQIATGVLAEMESDVPEQPQVEQTPEVDALDAERVQQMIEERFQSQEARATEQRAIDNVMSEVREAGYDPNTAEGFMVLWNANNQTGGDIKAAAEMVKGYRQGIIDDYVAGRTSNRFPMPSPAGVQAVGSPEPIKNLDDARRATDAFLRERRGA